MRPLYVFAGSGHGKPASKKPKKGGSKQSRLSASARMEMMKNEPPLDFWNRMDWQLPVESPLTDAADRDIGVYLTLFMRRALAKHDIDNASVFATDRLLKLDYEAAAVPLRKHWKKAMAVLTTLITKKEFRVLRTASEEFVRSVLISRDSELTEGKITALATKAAKKGSP